MGLPRLTYNSKNVDFAEDCSALDVYFPSAVLGEASWDGTREVLLMRHDINVRAFWETPVTAGDSDSDLKRKLLQFQAWAQSGGAWTFARDSAKVSQTTLSANAAAGASTLTVTSISGFAGADLCVLRSKTRSMLIKINGAPSGSTITLTETLDFAFASGCRLRHAEFWHGKLIEFDADIIREHPPLHYDVDLNFAEDVNSLAA